MASREDVNECELEEVRDHHVRRVIHKDPRYAFHTAMRTRSRLALDILAKCCSDGLYDFAELKNEFLTRGETVDVSSMKAEWLLGLSEMLLLQLHRTPEDIRLGDAILDSALITLGVDVVSQRLMKIAVDSAARRGDFSRARNLADLFPWSPSRKLSISVNLNNPFARRAHWLSEEAWLRALNRLVSGTGLLPITLLDNSESLPFDRLSTTPADQKVASGQDPLVTAVVTAFKPDDGLLTAVRSLVQQTWSNLEVLIIDDASGPAYDKIYERALALDSRVRLIRQTVNGGTYRARTKAMIVANGEFITFQDSDDWSRPERIERQVKPLLEDKKLIATHSYCVRFDDNLLYDDPGYQKALRLNSSSLMFRLEEVTRRVGYFDTVRKGGDSEFQERIEKAFGHPIPVVGDLPLAFVRLAPDSLSRAEFQPRWRHQARTYYPSLYREWHGRVADQGKNFFIDYESEGRTFGAPNRFLCAHDRSTEFDVVIGGDLRYSEDSCARVLDLMRRYKAQGHKVGLVDMQSFTNTGLSNRLIRTSIAEQVNRGETQLLASDEKVSANVLIIEDPCCLQFAEEKSWELAFDRVECLMNETANQDEALRYSKKDCGRISEIIFGRSPTWIPRYERTTLNEGWMTGLSGAAWQ